MKNVLIVFACVVTLGILWLFMQAATRSTTAAKASTSGTSAWTAIGGLLGGLAASWTSPKSPSSSTVASPFGNAPGYGYGETVQPLATYGGSATFSPSPGYAGAGGYGTPFNENDPSTW